MAKKQAPETGVERVIFTLPKSLASELAEYAQILRKGNKSGFVADAIRSYIDQFRKRRHTALLRQSYAAAAEQARAVGREWDSLDEEAWSKLDELEKKRKKFD